MNPKRYRLTLLAGGAAACGALALARAGAVTPDNPEWGLNDRRAARKKPAPDANYLRAIEETAGMVGDAEAQTLAKRLGLDVLNLTWEDTGRYKNSAVGPNISDMTI